MRKPPLLVVLAFAAVFCACKSRTPDDTVTIGVLQHSSSIPIIVAYKEELFKKHRVAVTLKTLTPAEHMPSLLRGATPILSPSSFPVIFSTAQQNPRVVTAYMTGGEATDGDVLYGIVTKKTSSATSLRDFVGKKIGSASKFTVVNLRNVLAAKLGDAAGSTIIREIADKGSLLDALRRDVVDAIVLDQPALSTREITEEFKIIDPNFRAKYLGSPYWSGSGVARRDWVSGHKDQFELYLTALDEALEVCKNEPLRAKRDFISYFELQGLDPAAIGLYVYPNSRFSPPLDFQRELSSILTSNGMLNAGFVPTELFKQ